MTEPGRGLIPTSPLWGRRSATGDPSTRRLTVEHCRRLLGPDYPKTDVELEALLDQLYAFANVCVDAFMEQCGDMSANTDGSGIESTNALAVGSIGQLAQAQ